MFQENELVNLFSAIAAIIIFMSIFRRIEISKLPFFYIGFAWMLCAYVCTLVESVIWGKFFNFAEHLSLALAGVSFAIASWSFGRSLKQKEENE